MIKNIIFDFGDVFINLDKEATYRELERLKVDVSLDMVSWYQSYEVGNISTQKFIDKVHEKNTHVSQQELIDAWNAILLDFPLKRLSFLKELKKSNKYRLILLSNTNDLHITWIKKNWGMPLYNEFMECFEQFYLSHEIGFRKPNEDIYNFVLEKNNLLPSETIFIDDTEENTKSAQKLGIHVWNIDPLKEDVVSLLTRKEFSI